MNTEVLYKHALIILIIFLSFLMRYFLSDWNSYWYDELLSVGKFGLSNSSALELIRNVSLDDHPPLYQLILFYWMQLFGDGEITTRCLSNLYIAGATLLLYLIVRKMYATRVAIAASIFFSLMFIPVYYAMETRSYAQSIFLSCLSSYLLFFYMGDLTTQGWRKAFCNIKFLYIVLVNLALLLTHYFNAFFLAAQGVFLFIYVLHSSRDRLIEGALKVVVAIAIPGILFLAVWGPLLFNFYTGYVEAGLMPENPSNPLSLFLEMVVRPNLKNSVLFGFRNFPFLGRLHFLRHSWIVGRFPWLLIVGALLLLLVIGSSAAQIWRRQGSDRQYATLYFAITAFVPCFIAWLVLLGVTSQDENLYPRYFAFSTFALTVLLVLTIEAGVVLASRLAGGTFARHYLAYSLLYACVTAALLVVPDGQRAATAQKEDYRGIAAMLDSMVEADTGHSYIVFEISRSNDLGYYLSRLKSKVPVHAYTRDNITLHTLLEKHAAEIAKNDYLVLAFTHYTTKDFHGILARLDKHYVNRLHLVDRGRGLIIYQVGIANHE